MSSFTPPRTTKRARREQARADRLAAEQEAAVRDARRRRLLLLAGRQDYDALRRRLDALVRR